MELAVRFRELREGVGLTKTALAKPKYTVSFVSQIEAGRRRPSPEAMEFFADRLGVTVGYLSTGVPDGIDVRLHYRVEEARQALRAGHLPQAEGILREALEEAERFQLARLAAQTRAVLGEVLSGQEGRMREALDLFEEAIEGKLPDQERAGAVNQLANVYRSLGDLVYAADLVENYLGKRDDIPLDPATLSDLQSTLISIYFERGDMVRAERAAARALAGASEAPPEIRAIALWNASRVLAESRRWEEALDYARRARLLMEQVDDRRRVGRLHNVYAYLCLEVEPPRTEEARKHLDEAESRLKESGVPGDLAYVFDERSRLAFIEGKHEEALTWSEQAMAQSGTDELQTARSLFLQGRVLAALERPRDARQTLQLAADMFRKRGARQQEAACWRELGELDLAGGDVTSAVEALRAGLRALEPARTRA